MDRANLMNAAANNARPDGEALFRIVLNVELTLRTRRRLRSLIHRRGGELKEVRSPETRRPDGRTHLTLGRRRIDDVVTALEAAGFTVAAVVATQRATRHVLVAGTNDGGPLVTLSSRNFHQPRRVPLPSRA
jgi:hypothetical protein